MKSQHSDVIFAYSEKQGKLINFNVDKDPTKGITDAASFDFGKGHTLFAPTYVSWPGADKSSLWLLTYKASDGAVNVFSLDTYRWTSDLSFHYYTSEFSDDLPSGFTAVTSLNDFFGTYYVFWGPGTADDYTEYFYMLGKEARTEKPVVHQLSKDTNAYVSKDGGQSAASYVTIGSSWRPDAVWVDHERNYDTIRVTTDFAAKLKTSKSPEKLDFGTPCDVVYGCPKQIFLSLWFLYHWYSNPA